MASESRAVYRGGNTPYELSDASREPALAQVGDVVTGEEGDGVVVSVQRENPRGENLTVAHLEAGEEGAPPVVRTTACCSDRVTLVYRRKGLAGWRGALRMRRQPAPCPELPAAAFQGPPA